MKKVRLTERKLRTLLSALDNSIAYLDALDAAYGGKGLWALRARQEIVRDKALVLELENLPRLT